jgi:HrpA-like RNA helicase
VLDELIADPSLSNYSCLVLDEAHERTINIDVIIGTLKGLFKNARKGFKVIITSASMDIKLFENYFKTYCSNIRFSSIRIPGRQYHVRTTYLDYHYLKDSIKKIEKAIDEEVITERDEMKS